jgi:hypothetical protein
MLENLLVCGVQVLRHPNEGAYPVIKTLFRAFTADIFGDFSSKASILSSASSTEGYGKMFSLVQNIQLQNCFLQSNYMAELPCLGTPLDPTLL